MLPQLRHASDFVLAAVDINFIRDYGVRLLAWCDSSPRIAGVVIFGAPEVFDSSIAAIYRYPCNNTLYGYETDELRQAIEIVWRDFFRAKNAESRPNTLSDMRARL
ncbi:MAG: hypothetical protein AAF224_05920 [Pseudomonadota bacterium]